jgi:hypothetical protein
VPEHLPVHLPSRTLTVCDFNFLYERLNANDQAIVIIIVICLIRPFAPILHHPFSNDLYFKCPSLMLTRTIRVYRNIGDRLGERVKIKQ